MNRHIMRILFSKLFFYILLLSYSISGFGQDKEYEKYLDSLESYLTKKDDSLKLLAISDLAWEYNSIDVNRAIRLSLKGAAIAGKLKRKYAIGQAYADLGTSYYFKRDFDSSAYYYLKALNITKNTGDSLELASLYNKLGALYKERAEYQTSLSYSFKSLAIYQKLKNQRKAALLYNNIGVSYEELKNFKLAASYYKKALNINIQENNKEGIARNYVGMGNVSITLNKMDEAFVYYQKAAAIFRELGWGIELSVALNNMGDVLDHQKKYDASLEKRLEALQIAEEIEDIQSQAKYHLYVADVLMKMKRFEEALPHIHTSEKLFTDIRSHEIQMDLFEMYSKYYFGSDDFEKGSDFLNKFHALKDSVYSAELSENIASMEVKHNTQQLRLEKAEAEAKKLRATQQRNYIALGTLFLLITGSVIFYNSRQKIKRTEERKRISAMLQSEEEERARIARDLHDGLGQILSTARINAAALEGVIAQEDEPILRTTLNLIDQSVTDLRSISHNLMPQVLSEKGLIEAVRELTDKINSARELQVQFFYPQGFPPLEKPVQVVLYRVIQEIVNNMLKHASATAITITLLVRNRTFIVQIEDNGKGFDTELIEKSSGTGWKNIKTRLSLISAQLRLTSEAGKGTKVLIEGTV